MAYISPKDIKPDSMTTFLGVKIFKYLLKDHNINNISLPTKRASPLVGITIHCTNDIEGVADDCRQYTAATINNNMGECRTNLYVDELGGWQNLDLSDMNWTCGDYSTGKGSKRTISIETIMNGTSGTDNEKARDNAARIAAYLLKMYGLTANDLFTHNYWLNIRNGKTGTYDELCTIPTKTRDCPYYILHWQDGWTGFRKLVDSYVVQLGGKSVFTSNVNADDKITPVVETNTTGDIYYSYGVAAIRTGTSKNASMKSRVERGGYYPIECEIKQTDGTVWLKHAGQTLFSMLADGSVLFKKCGKYKAYTTTTRINVRENPSMSANKIGILNASQKVYTFKDEIANDGSNDWQKIIYDNKVAYCAASYLKG